MVILWFLIFCLAFSKCYGSSNIGYYKELPINKNLEDFSHILPSTGKTNKNVFLFYFEEEWNTGDDRQKKTDLLTESFKTLPKHNSFSNSNKKSEYFLMSSEHSIGEHNKHKYCMNEDSTDEDSMNDDSTDDDSTDEDSTDKDCTDEDCTDDDFIDEDSIEEDSRPVDFMDDDFMDEDSRSRTRKRRKHWATDNISNKRLKKAVIIPENLPYSFCIDQNKYGNNANVPRPTATQRTCNGRNGIIFEIRIMNEKKPNIEACVNIMSESPLERFTYWTKHSLKIFPKTSATYKFDSSDLIDKEIEVSYKDTHWDKGHLTPTADFDSDIERRMTYYYINAAPQAPSVNRASWKIIECAIRRIKDNNNLQVITGTLGEIEKLGSKTKVPKLFFKLAIKDISNQWKKGVAFIALNTKTNNELKNPKTRKTHLQLDPKETETREKELNELCIKSICKDIKAFSKQKQQLQKLKYFVTCCTIEDFIHLASTYSIYDVLDTHTHDGKVITYDLLMW